MVRLLLLPYMPELLHKLLLIGIRKQLRGRQLYVKANIEELRHKMVTCMQCYKNFKHLLTSVMYRLESEGWYTEGVQNRKGDAYYNNCN